MRFKDFGEVDKSIRLSDNLVSVSTTSVQDSAQINYLMATNKAHLEPWKTTQQPTENPTNYFLTIKYKNVVVGQIVLWRFKDNPKSCSISYWIGLDFCGRGLATAAVSLVTTYAFEHLGLVSIEAKIDEKNLSSIRVAEKAKFIKSQSLSNQLLTSPEASEQGIYTLTKE
jgi:[ribosomal protein S5]-alanine N-acetyltransferase